MKILKKLALVFLLLITMTIVSGVVISYTYRDEITNQIIKQINRNINAPITVKSTDFSVLKKFPYASLIFSEVAALEAKKGSKDTLFQAKRIYLQFNVMDIFHGNYTIKKIQVKESRLHLYVDNKGKENYHFWKENKEDNAAFTFALEKVIFDDISISYINELTHQDFEIFTEQLFTKGKFSQEKYTMWLESKLNVHHFIANGIDYLPQREVEMDVKVKMNNKTKKYSFEEGKMKIDKQLQFVVTGELIETSSSTQMNLVIDGKELDIHSLFALFPPAYTEKFSDYESTGIIDCRLVAGGKLSTTDNPSVKIDFGIKNGTLKQSSTGYELKNIYLQGSYSNGKNNNQGSSYLSITSLKANLGEGELNSTVEIRNFVHPFVKTSLTANLNLSDVQQFIKLDTIKQIKGNINVDLLFSGRITSLNKITAEDFNKANTSGKVIVNNAEIELKDNSLIHKNLNGAFFFHNNDVLIQDLQGSISSADYKVDGLFRNALAYLFLPEQKITIEADIISSQLNLDELLASNTSNTSESNYMLAFPDKANLNLNIKINNIFFRNFKATNIHGIIQLKNKILNAEKLTFATMNGSVALNGWMDGSNPEVFNITCQAEINNVNINQMFIELENFGQQIVESKHLQGITTASIYFKCDMNSNLKIDVNSVYAYSDISIDKGELIDFEPMMALSSYIKIYELKHITFSTLKNNIEIKNKVITIPYMDIHSSAINISGSGTHTFNNAINYKIKVGLNELLAKKAKKAKKENDEFGVIKEDEGGGITLFISMTGTATNPIIKYDKKGWEEKFKQDMKQEKHTMKRILKDEFGWFKKDTALNQPDVKEKENDFIIEWEENKQSTKQQKDTVQKENNKSGIKKWLKKITTEGNDTSKVDWGEDY